jgi:hypothetical protein
VEYAGRIRRIKLFKDSKRQSSGGIALLYAQGAQERDGFKKTKLRRHSALIRARSPGKRLRAVGSHSEIPTAVGSGEAVQMLSAGVGVQKRRKTEIHNHRISFKFPERTRAVRSDRSCEGDIPSGKAKVKSRHNQDRLFGRTRGNDRAPSGEAR